MTKAKPVTGWCIKSGNILMPAYVGGQRNLAIKDFEMNTKYKWKQLRLVGYRCVKVQITEV